MPVDAPAKQKLRFDAKGFVPAILGIFLGVALASHVPADAAHGVAAQNLLGNNGVEIASILYGKLGVASWALAVVLVGWGWRIVLRKPLAGIGKMFIGAMLSVGAGALALAVLWSVPDWPLRSGLGGGLLGDILYAEVVLMVSAIGIAADTVGWFSVIVSLASMHLALGGQFRIHSELGKGTTVEMELPISSTSAVPSSPR